MSKEITSKKELINVIKQNGHYMNSENSKKSDLHRLLLNLLDKINLKRSDKYVPLSNLGIYCTWKNIKKSHTKTINLKYPCHTGLINFILYQIFKIIFLSILSKNMKH